MSTLTDLIKVGFRKRQATAIISAIGTEGGGGGGGEGSGVILGQRIATCTSWAHGSSSDGPTSWTLSNAQTPGEDLAMTVAGASFHPNEEGWYSVSYEINLGWAASPPTAVQIQYGGYYNSGEHTVPVTPAGLVSSYAGLEITLQTPPSWLPAYGANGDTDAYLGLFLTYNSAVAQPTQNGNSGAPMRAIATVTRWA